MHTLQFSQIFEFLTFNILFEYTLWKKTYFDQIIWLVLHQLCTCLTYRKCDRCTTLFPTYSEPKDTKPLKLNGSLQEGTHCS